MRKIHVAVFTALMVSVVALPAQDSSTGRRGIPEAAEYSDLLTGGKKSGPREIKSPDAKAFRDLLGPGKKSGTNSPQLPQSKVRPQSVRAKAQVSDLEIDRVIAEAGMHLGQIAEKSAVCIEDAEAVFEEAIALVVRRLEEMEKERKREDAKKKSSIKESVRNVEEKNAGKPQSTSAGAGPVSSKGRERPAATLAPDRGPSELLGRWAAQLRRLADQIDKEAGSGKSANN